MVLKMMVYGVEVRLAGAGIDGPYRQWTQVTGTPWSGVVWYGMVWYDMACLVWHDMVRHGMHGKQSEV